RAQPRVLEHVLFGAADVPVVGIERHADALGQTARLPADIEPAAMDTVARAIDVAARDALVRLHDVEARAPPRRGRRARKRPVAPEFADMEWIDLQHAARAPALRRARDQRYFGT